MVFNSAIVLSVAHVSAEAWQQISCLRLQHRRRRLTAPQLLDLLCCFPLHQLGRFALCLWSFLCLPPPDSFYSYSYYTSSSSSSDDDDSDGGDGASSSSSSPVRMDDYYHHSHSD
ncbi:hypothetical protein LINPERPRIM_LOCUS22590 [Linum perenne]